MLQHEIDHLDGVLILDRTARDQRKGALRALREGDTYSPSRARSPSPSPSPATGEASSTSAPPTSPRRCCAASPATRAPAGARGHPARPPRGAAAASSAPPPVAEAAARARDRAAADRGDERAGGAGGGSGRPSRDVGVVCAFGQLIREPLLAELELLNVHPSLLPRWRGAAPIERAIMAGDERTGVTIMRVTEGLDSGPIALREAVAIGDDDFGTARRSGSPSSAASCWSRALDLRARRRARARRAGRRRGDLRREDRARASAGSTPRARRSSSSGGCGR